MSDEEIDEVNIREDFVPVEDEQEKVKKKRKKTVEKTIKIEGTQKFVDEVRQDKNYNRLGVADIIINNNGVLSRERIEGNILKTILTAVQYKINSPEKIIKVTIRK